MANLFTNNQDEVTIQELSVSSPDEVLLQVHDFGGLTLQLPGAFAQLSADQAMALETIKICFRKNRQSRKTKKSSNII